MPRYPYAGPAALLLLSWPIAGSTLLPPPADGMMRPPSSPDDAIRSEFRAAEKCGTRQAYRLFAQRHPDHPLAQEALRRANAQK